MAPVPDGLAAQLLGGAAGTGEADEMFCLPAGSAAPFAVAARMGAAYRWCTSSTSVANPAGTLARMLTDSFTGTDPRSTGAFLVAEPVGAALGVSAITTPDPSVPDAATDVVPPHPAEPANPQAPQQEVHI